MPGLSYLNRPSQGLLKQVNNKARPEYDRTLRQQIGEFARSEQENSPPAPVTTTQSWKEEHTPAEDWELKPDNMSDCDSSGAEGPSRGHIQHTRFEKNNAKVRKQSPTEKASDDAARTKKRRTSAEKRADSSTRGYSRAKSPAESKGTAQDRRDVIFGDLKPKKTTNTYGGNKNAPKTSGSRPASNFLRGREDINRTFSSKPKPESPTPAGAKKFKGTFECLVCSFKTNNPSGRVRRPTVRILVTSSLRGAAGEGLGPTR